MAITFPKIRLPIGSIAPAGVPAIQIDGAPDSPIYVKVEKVAEGTLTNEEGHHRVIKAFAQELDSDGIEIANSTGPTFSDTLDGKAIALGKVDVNEQLRGIRLNAILGFLSRRRVLQEAVPDELTEVTGAVQLNA